MTTTIYTQFDSPLGCITLEGDGHFLTGLYLPNHKHWRGIEPGWRRADESFAAARKQLDEYFAGHRHEFDLPLKLRGTAFQQRVWQELVRIPWGATISYAQLAQRVALPNAFRAVGNANGRNPVSIVVPCHRVIASDGKLAGYGGGIENKKWLLTWEQTATAVLH